MLPEISTAINIRAFAQACGTSEMHLIIPNCYVTFTDHVFWQSTIGTVEFLGDVKSLGSECFYRSGARKVIFHSLNPPTIPANCFTYCTASIYVPDESLSIYKSATNWSKFASQIKPLSEYTD